MNQIAQCKDYFEAFLSGHQAIGESYSADEWAVIEKTVPATPPPWYKSLITQAKIARVSYRLSKSFGVRRCIIYSGATTGALFSHVIDLTSKITSGWAFEWFPVGSAEDGNYWVLNPNEAFHNHKLYLMDYQMINPNIPVKIGNGVFSTGQTIVEVLSFSIPTRMNEELW